MREALYARMMESGAVQCRLCPHFCVLEAGQKGFCRTRQNVGGTLMALNDDLVTAFHLDPIEKKPLYHFKPGSLILSVGSFGCNFACGFCQNHSISLGETYDRIQVSSRQLVRQARKVDINIGLAYTYNEPTVFYELMLETAQAIREAGMVNVLVSNGYINPEPLEALIPWMDGANIDLKAFDNTFYRKYTRGTLPPVLETIRRLHAAHVHLEITHLLIQGFNDNIRSFVRMCEWIAALDPGIPFHVSRYYPAYKFSTHATDLRLIRHYAETAKKFLKYVYIGNVAYADNNTYCPSCGRLLIRRTPVLEWDSSLQSCPICGEPIPIVI